MSVYFGSVNYIQERIMHILEKEGIKHIIIVGSSMNMIDMNGMEMLEEVAHMLQKIGGGLYFLDLKLNVQNSLKKAGFMKTIGEEYFFSSKK